MNTSNLLFIRVLDTIMLLLVARSNIVVSIEQLLGRPKIFNDMTQIFLLNRSQKVGKRHNLMSDMEKQDRNSLLLSQGLRKSK